MKLHVCLSLAVLLSFLGTAHAENACKDKKTRVKVVQGTLSEADKKELEKRYEKACSHTKHTMSIEQEGNDVYVVCKCG